MLRVCILVSTLILFTHPMDIVNRNCNFPTVDTCVRIDVNVHRFYNEMHRECEKHDLSMMPADATYFKKMRSILWFRYDNITQFPLDRLVFYDEERTQIESDMGIKISSDGEKVGWTVYNYLNNTLHLVDRDDKLPTVCFSPFKPRLQCQPNFRLIYPRLTCYGVVMKNQYTKKYNNEQCKAECLALKSNLGAFHSVEEKTNYMKKLGIYQSGSFWVGTRFRHDSNEYKGKDRLAVRKTAYNMDGSIWNNFEGAFEDDEPNAYGRRSENCIEWRVYHGDYKTYNDLPCSNLLEGCVCESAPDQTNVQYSQD